MISQILQPGLDAPIVFADDEDEAVGPPYLPGQALEALRRLALRIFLVHSIEDREVDLLGVDQLHVVTPGSQPFDHVPSQPNAGAVGPIRTVEDKNAIAHDLTSVRDCDGSPPRCGGQIIAAALRSIARLTCTRRTSRASWRRTGRRCASRARHGRPRRGGAQLKDPLAIRRSR